MNDILIVPDVHGRAFWESALDFKGEIIFLGDYTDPYPDEGITMKRTYDNFLRIIEFKKQNAERVTLLVGNHELHYYDNSYRCSRFNFLYCKRYQSILTGKETKHLFQLCRQIENYLLVHAGILKEWYDLHYANFVGLGNSLEEQLNNYFKVNKGAFYEISAAHRCGFNSFGSPLWADIQEHAAETEHFDNEMVQIIGHTQLEISKPFMTDRVILLDNRRVYLLKNDYIEEYK